MNRQLAQAREEVCDSYILSASDAPKYGRTLLAIAELVGAPRPLPGTVGLFASRWKLENRVAGLLDTRRSRMTRLTTKNRLLVGCIAPTLVALNGLGTMTLATDDPPLNDVLSIVAGPEQSPNQSAKKDLEHSDPKSVEPMTKNDLINEWGKRADDYPFLHVVWRSDFVVDLGEIELSPFEETPPNPQSGIMKLGLGENDEFWLRKNETKIRFSELNRFKGAYTVFRKEKNVFRSESRTRIDDIAQGEIESDVQRLDLSNLALNLLELNYRPTSSPLYNKLLAGRVYVMPKTRVWAGREATVVSSRRTPNPALEYFFDSTRKGHYLGFHQRTSKRESRLEITHQLSSSSTLVTEARFSQTRVPYGNLIYSSNFTGYSFHIPESMPDADLTIDFDSGFLVGKQGDSHVMSNDGQLLPLNQANRKLLDPRVSQPARKHEPVPVPATLRAEVEIGGIIVDEAGNPIQGATISSSIQSSKQATTDKEGHWSCTQVPKELRVFKVEITHSDYQPMRATLAVATFTLLDGTRPRTSLVMKRGLTVTGTILSRDGQPVPNAIIRTKFLNEVRRATTNMEGKYQLTGCEAVPARIVVSAKSMAIDMQQVNIAQDMDPVDFVMQPGGHIRIRVVDEHNQPIRKARIFFQDWRVRSFANFAFRHVDQAADENGIWEWNEAPLDEFQADICHDGGMQLRRQTLLARPEDYVFSPPLALVIVGEVVDAETDQPIEEFQVIPGMRGSPQQMNWVDGKIFDARDGQFEYRRIHDYFAHLLKVQATGYLPTVSRDIKSDEGRIEIRFELQRGTDINMRVMTPDGLPAVGAQVALGIPGAQVKIQNGHIDDGSTYAQRSIVNGAGRFRFPAQPTAYQIVIVSKDGYAHVNSETADRLDLVRLTAWAKAEGVYRVGGEVAAGVKIYLNSGNVHSYGNEVPSIFTSSEVVTGPDGRYRFSRVLAGRGRIQRSILHVVDQGAREVTSATAFAREFVPNETTTVNFGDIGSAVVARLLPPKRLTDRVLWSFADVQVRSQFGLGPPPVPDELKGQPERQDDWFEAWRKSDAGEKWSAAKLKEQFAPVYSATVDRDGRFKIDDMLAGDYVLSVRFPERPGIGNINGFKFTVSSESVVRRTPVNLGDIELQ